MKADRIDYFCVCTGYWGGVSVEHQHNVCGISRPTPGSYKTALEGDVWSGHAGNTASFHHNTGKYIHGHFFIYFIYLFFSLFRFGLKRASEGGNVVLRLGCYKEH